MVQFHGQKKSYLGSVKEVICECELSKLRAIGQILMKGPVVFAQGLFYLWEGLKFIWKSGVMILVGS